MAKRVKPRVKKRPKIKFKKNKLKKKKSKSKKSSKTVDKTVAYSKKRTSEKIFFLAAILFIIFSIIILFNPEATTLVTLDTTLTKTSYELDDFLSGQVKLEMQPRDILPADTRVEMNILSGTEISKCGTTICPEVYLCPDGQIIPWMFCNITGITKKCRNVTYDSGYTGYPDKECCYINQENCFGFGEALRNTGFEQQLAGNWFPTKSGSCMAYRDTSIKLGTSLASGRTDTTQATSTSTTYDDFAKLTQGFTAIPISYLGTYTGTTPRFPTATASAVEDFYDSFGFWVRYYVPASTTTQRQGYYFEVIVTGKDSSQTTTRRLHYYFNINKLAPADTYNDKYITLPNPPISTWKSYTRNLHNDWRSKGFPGTDVIIKIELHSAGKLVQGTVNPINPDNPGTSTYTTTIYGQQVNWDNVTMKYDSSTVSTCIGKDKKCCVNGTGIGNYYGEQLICEAGECWDDCTASYSMSLEEFIAMSTTPDSGNLTSGAFKSGTRILGGTGTGYGYCFDTIDEDNPSCYGWNNKYILELGDEEFEIEVPPYTGTYDFFLNITYINFLGMVWGLDSVKKTFAVGGTVGPSCPDSDYNFATGNWSDWGNCINNNKTRTRIFYGTYAGSENCPGTRNKTETETQGCVSCTPSLSCEWQPCIAGETQENTCTDLNYCEPDYVSETRVCCIEDWSCGSWSSCENGEHTRDCYDAENCDTEFNKPVETETCEKPFFITLWWLWLLIVLVIVIAVLVIKGKVLFKPKRRATSIATASTEYSELVNYIEQAFSYGATREEIKRKLSEAGWPNDSVDKAFKVAGR